MCPNYHSNYKQVLHFCNGIWQLFTFLLQSKQDSAEKETPLSEIKKNTTST